MIDFQGFRPNVGIILSNAEHKLLWAKRLRQNAWQFPQGGIQRGETPEQALYRELEEELGLLPADVDILGSTRDWLRYHLPERLIQRHRAPVCIGQKQKWFMLRLRAEETHIVLDRGVKPEFDAWRWTEYWHPLQEVVFFKRDVYRRALLELEACLLPKP